MDTTTNMNTNNNTIMNNSNNKTNLNNNNIVNNNSNITNNNEINNNYNNLTNNRKINKITKSIQHLKNNIKNVSIFNPFNVNIPSDEMFILGLGHKFKYKYYTHTNIIKSSLINSCKNFSNLIKYKYSTITCTSKIKKFHNGNIQHIIYNHNNYNNKSVNNTNDSSSKSLNELINPTLQLTNTNNNNNNINDTTDKFINNTIQKIKHLHIYNKLSQIDKVILEGISNLYNNKDIIIKPADKNLGLVILPKDKYIELCNDILKDGDTYKLTNNKDFNDTVILNLKNILHCHNIYYNYDKTDKSFLCKS
jgi:hypothetical protein